MGQQRETIDAEEMDSLLAKYNFSSKARKEMKKSMKQKGKSSFVSEYYDDDDKELLVKGKRDREPTWKEEQREAVKAQETEEKKTEKGIESEDDYDEYDDGQSPSFVFDNPRNHPAYAAPAITPLPLTQVEPPPSTKEIKSFSFSGDFKRDKSAIKGLLTKAAMERKPRASQRLAEIDLVKSELGLRYLAAMLDSEWLTENRS